VRTRRGHHDTDPMLQFLDRTDEISPADNRGAVLTVIRWANANLATPCPPTCGGSGRLRTEDYLQEIRELCDMLGLDMAAAATR
jgi:hypothetical protein